MVFIAGLSFLLYPYLQGAITDQRIMQEAHKFLEMVETRPMKQEESIPKETESPVSNSEKTEAVAYPELLTAMQSYNQQLWEEKQAGLCDPLGIRATQLQAG